jgi:hypothetical protein
MYIIAEQVRQSNSDTRRKFLPKNGPKIDNRVWLFSLIKEMTDTTDDILRDMIITHENIVNATQEESEMRDKVLKKVLEKIQRFTDD